MESTVEILESGKKPHTMMSQVNRMRALVLSTPRTGSIYVSELIHQHFKRLYSRVQHLGEFLNPYHYNLYFEEQKDGTVLNHHTYAPGRHMWLPAMGVSGRIDWAKIRWEEPVNVEEETLRRSEMLKRATTTFVLHHHVYTEALAEEVLKTEFDLIVVCRRRNVWDQILSYGLAYHTKKFKHIAGSELDIPAFAVTLDKKVFDTLVYRIKQLKAILPTLPNNVITLWYEDVAELSPKEILSKIGVPTVLEEADPRISVKTPYKLTLEQYYNQDNLAEIAEWFNKEFA